MEGLNMLPRRTFFTAVGGALLIPYPAREAIAGERGHPTIFEKFHRSLVQVHGELRDGVRGILDAVVNTANDSNVTDERIAALCLNLLNHHKAEDAFFFPAFRAAGRLRSSDVAFLDARDAEHHEVHRLCLELREVGQAHQRGAVAPRVWRATVRRVCTELAAISAPHFDIEESTLTPTHVATLITIGELVAVYRDMGQKWNRR
jgi:hemerythrin-like domain-containing protein